MTSTTSTSTLAPPPTPTLVELPASIADGSSVTFDDYRVFILEVSGAAIQLIYNEM